MTTYTLDPDELMTVASSTETGLSDMETHRGDTSTAVDVSMASSQSAEVSGALINVWNVLLAPQFEGAEQRLVKMLAGLRGLASAYNNGDQDMMDDSVSRTDAAVDIDITDAKQP